MKTITVIVSKNRAEEITDAIFEACKQTGVKFEYLIDDAPNSHQARYVAVWLNGEKRTSTVTYFNKQYLSGSSLTKLKDVVSRWFERKMNITLKFDYNV